MIRSKTVGYKIFTVINYVILTLIGFLCLAPMLHTVFASFSEPGPLSAHIGFIFRPLGFTLNGYVLVFQNPNIYTGYVNTIIYVIFATLLGTVLTITSGYVLSRKQLLLKNQMMFFLAFTMMFNGGMIPFYMVVRNLGMLDTRWALIIPGCVNVFNIIIMRTSMAEIPDSLEEAASFQSNHCGCGSVLCGRTVEFLVQCIYFSSGPLFVPASAHPEGYSDTERFFPDEPKRSGK